MRLLLTFSSGSYAQFITVLVVFVIVLGITALVTKWIAGYQKQQGVNNNVEVIETSRIANNKYIQIVRVGEKYMVIAVCKDTVTMLGEIPKEQLREENSFRGMRFKDILDKAAKKNSEEPEENHVHDEV
ncbi:MAG: flagellar biosynthetic protein FliO [Acetatifactor sp.]